MQNPYKLPPLAERLRPQNLNDYVGQEHLIGENAILRKMLETGNLYSFILWGPPGVGKTSFAQLLAKKSERSFYTLSAVSSGVKDVRDVIEKSKQHNIFDSVKLAPILFIDEIHRFNKAQQDALLDAVEKGLFILIGATTENPSFEIITPLLSRCQVFVLKELSKENLNSLLNKALNEDILLSKKNIEVKETEALFLYSGGDGRKMLGYLELIVNAQSNNNQVIINNKIVKDTLSENLVAYDKNGDLHYDVISAFIKSIRGSDPNAALYYLAKMLIAGENPVFIARRLCISAAEDIGLANPNAMLLANACFDIVNKIGMPEARIALSETTIYLAASRKSNSAYKAINEAIDFVKNNPDYTVPLALRNAPTSLMKELNYSAGYKYSHDYPNNFIKQEFLPKEISNTVFYHPQDNKTEEQLKSYLDKCWKED